MLTSKKIDIMKLQDNKIEITIYSKIVINFELHIKEKYMQDNLQNQNISPIQSQPIENPVEIKKKNWIKISLSALIGVLIFTVLATAGYVYFKTVKPSLAPETSVKKEWVGIVETKKGLVKLSPQGILERDSSSKVKAVIPPWSKALDEGDAVPRDLLQDGQIVFTGSPKIPSATKEHILYSWTVDSSTSPTPLLKLSNGQKIQSFAVSPNGKQVGIISITRTQEEIYEDQSLRGLPTEEARKIVEERNKQLEQEIATISIYDLEKGKLVNTLKLQLIEGKPRGSADKLVWKTSGLFVLGSREVTLFNPQRGQLIDTIRDEGRTGAGPLRDSILFSPDGLMFFDPIQSTVRKIPGGEIIARFEAPEIVSPERIDETKDLENQIMWVGPSVFSQDSKRVILQGRSVTQKNFIIWELDLESGKTQKIGDSGILKFGSIPVDQIKSLFLFMTYSPTGDRIIFAANYPTGDKIVATDLFQLKKGEQKAEFIDLFDGLNVFFLGWYFK